MRKKGTEREETLHVLQFVSPKAKHVAQPSEQSVQVKLARRPNCVEGHV